MPAERAGYSQRALTEKFGIKAGDRLAIVGAPTDFDAPLGALPPDVVRVPGLRASSDVVLFFTRDRRTLCSKFADLKRAMAFDGLAWVCWPKRTSGVVTDLDEKVVRELGLATGLVDVKVCAVDATWSGLKFVYRLKDRPAGATPRRAPRMR
jgi:hypothetical protein